MKRLSLRWRLILVSGTLALATALILGVLLHMSAERQLLEQLEKTLETKCDEVITVLDNAGGYAVLEDFLHIETTYRTVPYTYYYQIRDGQGRTLVRSENLQSFDLPLPDGWTSTTLGVRTATVRPPWLASHESLRVRTERIELPLRDRKSMHIIQTAVSLGPLTAVMRASLREAVLIATGVLVGVFLLLWFVTTGALRPMVVMTRKASQISATNLRERLPVAAHGDELDELATVLNGMLDRLASSMQQMERFSADAAHQLRTPLTRIRGELELILRSDVPGSLRPDLERIGVEVGRLSRLCARLLLLGRIDLQGGELCRVGERVDLKEVAEELIEQTRPLAHEHGITLQLAGVPSEASVRGNRMLIVEATLNLLDNAIRWTPRGGAVCVAVQATPEEASLSVEDSGPGIPPGERDHIFRAFYRLPRRPADAPNEGSGVGLAIVRAIAVAHGGSVKVYDAPHEGSVFRMTFPALRAG